MALAKFIFKGLFKLVAFLGLIGMIIGGLFMVHPGLGIAGIAAGILWGWWYNYH